MLKTDSLSEAHIGHGLNDLQCLWVRWTICIDNWATCCGLRHLQYWQKAIACRMPEGHRRLPTTASLRALVRELAVLWWLSCIACRDVAPNPLRTLEKETQAKKRHMLAVTQPHPKTTLHWHRLMRRPDSCPLAPNLSWEFWRLASTNTSRAKVFHPFKLQHESRFPKIPGFPVPHRKHVAHSNTLEINLQPNQTYMLCIFSCPFLLQETQLYTTQALCVELYKSQCCWTSLPQCLGSEKKRLLQENTKLFEENEDKKVKKKRWPPQNDNFWNFQEPQNELKPHLWCLSVAILQGVVQGWQCGASGSCSWQHDRSDNNISCRLNLSFFTC